MSMTIEERVEALERRLQALEEISMRLNRPKEDEVTSLTNALVKQYGYCVNKTTAAVMMGVTRSTVYNMLKDGRISAGMGGVRLDVRSIARYMASTGERKR